MKYIVQLSASRNDKYLRVSKDYKHYDTVGMFEDATEFDTKDEIIELMSVLLPQDAYSIGFINKTVMIVQKVTPITATKN